MKRLALFTIVTLAATSLSAGYRYRFESVVAQPRGERSTAGRVTVDHENARIEFDRGDEMLFADKAVVLSHDGGRSLTVIDPSAATYYQLGLDQVLSGTRKMEMTVAHPKVTVTDRGEGGEVNGFPTHRYDVDSSYDVTVQVMGQEMSNHIETKSELWVTEKLPTGLVTFVQLRGFRVGIEEVDRLIESETASIRGFPLKQVMTSTTTTSRRGSRSWTTTTTISDVKETDVPASAFEVPAGYTRTEVPVNLRRR